MNQPSTGQSTQSRPPGSSVKPSASVPAGPRTAGPGQASGAGQTSGLGQASKAGQATARDVQAKASEAARRVENQATAATEQVKQKASEAVRDATRKTYEAAERAKESGRQYAAEKKQVLAKEIDVFSSAIRKASTKLHEEEHSSIASYLDAAVEQLDEVREALQHRSVSELLDNAGQLARRRPELVYGGMFLAGLAAVRFLKASSRSPVSGYQHEHNSPRTAPPAPGASRPSPIYPSTPPASAIHRSTGFPDPVMDTPNQTTSPGETR